MSIYDVFSKRNRPRPAKLVYDDLPLPLRHSCIAIFHDCFGRWPSASVIDTVLMREHPVISFRQTRVDRVDALYGRKAPRFFEDCLANGNFDEAIDAVEVGALFVNTDVRDAPEHERIAYGLTPEPDAFLDELNARFLENGVGYQFST